MFVIRFKSTNELAIIGGEPEEKFIKKNYCETYNEYGQKVGCYDAGCWTPESADDFKEGDEISHVECLAYDYWTGHNWQTLIAKCDLVPETENVEALRWNEDEDDLELEKEILAAYEKAEFPAMFHNGYREAIANDWKFTETLWQSDFAIAWAEKL